MKKGRKGVILCMLVAAVFVMPISAMKNEGTNNQSSDAISVGEVCGCGTYNKVGIDFPLVRPEPPVDIKDPSPKPAPIYTPPYFSWKDYEGQDWTTPAKDQCPVYREFCGSCYLFAALGTLESIINIREGYAILDPDLSEQYQLSCLPRAGNCDYGGFGRAVFQYINDTSDRGNNCNGIIPETCFPYQADDDIPCSAKCSDWEDKLVPISDWGWYFVDGSPEDIEVMKTQIMQTGPIVSAMYWDWFFYDWCINHHDSDEYYPYLGPSKRANHEVVIVGWKDDPSIGNGGYWITKNSMGEEQGYDGFINIEYGSLGIDSEDIAWVDYDSESFDWAPVADTGGIYQGNSGQELTFDASRSVDPEGDIISYHWDFGDGTNATGVTAMHTYSHQGVYDVTLTVTDSNGKTGDDATWAFIDESNSPPETPVIEGRRRVKNETVYDFTFSATDPDADDVYYYIVWGRGFIDEHKWIGPFASGEEIILNHSWIYYEELSAGDFTIFVKAKDSYGFESNWATHDIKVMKTFDNSLPTLIEKLFDWLEQIFTREILPGIFNF